MRGIEKMPDIRELRLLDGCVTLGRLAVAGVADLTVDNVLEVMDAHDIAEALVHSNEARLVHPRSHGNERLLRDVAGLDRLHPVWALSPPARPDPSAAAGIVDEMISAGVRVARLMMGHVPPLHWIWKDLCEALEARRVPCLLDFAPLGPPATSYPGESLMIDKLRDICLAHPDLPMILS
ncbi:hypothetical protein LCGC14_2621450, partial [marine sediment metagenome]